jgi:hypothetical protein
MGKNGILLFYSIGLRRTEAIDGIEAGRLAPVFEWQQKRVETKKIGEKKIVLPSKPKVLLPR